jgi:hypothetical protein
VSERTAEQKFIHQARERFKCASEDERTIRNEAAIDLRFVAGDQWDAAIREQRIREGRPVLTFPRCHTFVQQVSNEARQNKSQIIFIPAEDGDKDTAEVYEGMARFIQSDVDAQIAYETAVEYSAGGSFGYFRYTTEYCKDDSGNLEVKVKPVLDPFAVYGILVPACFGQEPQFAFVTERIPKAEYERLYGDDAPVDWESDGKDIGEPWIGSESVLIAEYWYMEDGAVKSCKINGKQKLKDTETTWPGSTIPIVPVLGKQLIIDGKPQLFSVVRLQRGAQQLLNYYKTRVAESIGTAPVSPYIVVEGQIEGHEQEWANANKATQPFLTVKGIGIDGKPAPLPQRQVFEPPIAAMTEAASMEIDEMKASAGIFDASLGAQSNEQSGIALQRRQQQSSITNLHFLDNLERAFKKGGAIMAEVIPKVYDTPRMVRILGQDEAPKVVKINQQFDQNGRVAQYNIGGEGAGKYDVVVTMGRSFSTKRMESFDMMAQLVQANPELVNVIGDILFANSDMAGAQQLSERFKKMLPPNLQDAQDKNSPEELEARLAHAEAQNQQLTQALNEATDSIEKDKAKTESAERIAAEKNQTQLMLEQMRQEFEARRQDDQQQHEAAMEALRADLAEIQAAIGHDRTLEVQASQPEPRQEA